MTAEPRVGGPKPVGGAAMSETMCQAIVCLTVATFANTFAILCLLALVVFW